MTLLSVVKDVAVLVGEPEPTAVMNNTDDSVTYYQMARFVQQEGDELSRVYDWRKMKGAGVWTGDGTTTLFDLPSDFDRFIPGDAVWIVGRPMWPVEGPISDEDMVAIKAGPTRPAFGVWRMFGTQVEFYPAPASGVVYNYNYLKNTWVLSGGSTADTRVGSDSDTFRVPEQVLTLGAIWRWKKSKGLEYGEDFKTYQVQKLLAQRADGGLRKFRMRDKYDTLGRDPRRNAYAVIT